MCFILSDPNLLKHHVFVFQMLNVVLQTEHPKLYSVPLSKALNPLLSCLCHKTSTNNQKCYSSEQQELNPR